jgi:hypothetical protein
MLRCKLLIKRVIFERFHFDFKLYNLFLGKALFFTNRMVKTTCCKIDKKVVNKTIYCDK